MSGSKKGAKIKQFGIRWNIWKYTTGNGHSASDKYAHQHPAIFPEYLARDHIISWSNPGDLVLDPMCGSGTTLKMAKQTGRDYIGIDTSEKYCKLSEKRVAGAQTPLLLDMGRPNNRLHLTGGILPAQGDLFIAATPPPATPQRSCRAEYGEDQPK